MSSVEAQLSNVKRFTWSYNDVFKPSSISCLALSVDEARQLLLSYLVKLENLCVERMDIEKKWFECYAKTFKQKTTKLSYSDVVKKGEKDEITKETIDQLWADFDNKLPPIEYNIGCYCRPVWEYSRSMKVAVKSKIITLDNLILNTEPEVSDVKLVSFFSCLDG